MEEDVVGVFDAVDEAEAVLQGADDAGEASVGAALAGGLGLWHGLHEELAEERVAGVGRRVHQLVHLDWVGRLGEEAHRSGRLVRAAVLGVGVFESPADDHDADAEAVQLHGQRDEVAIAGDERHDVEHAACGLLVAFEGHGDVDADLAVAGDGHVVHGDALVYEDVVEEAFGIELVVRLG